MLLAGFHTQTACRESAEAVIELFTINTVNHPAEYIDTISGSYTYHLCHILS